MENTNRNIFNLSKKKSPHHHRFQICITHPFLIIAFLCLEILKTSQCIIPFFMGFQRTRINLFKTRSPKQVSTAFAWRLQMFTIFRVLFHALSFKLIVLQFIWQRPITNFCLINCSSDLEFSLAMRTQSYIMPNETAEHCKNAPFCTK